MASRSRPRFKQRKTLSQRMAAGFGVLLLTILIAVGLAYVTLPWTSGFAFRIFLNRSGWGPAAVHVTRFNTGGFEIRDVSLGGRAVTLADLAVSYSPRDLFHGRVNDITVSGLTLTAKWADKGLTVGPMHLTQPASSTAITPVQQQLERNGQEAQPFSFRHLVVAKTNLVLDLPKNPVTISVMIDLTSANGRWEGQFAADGSARQGDITAGLFRMGWQGAFSPAEPESAPGKGAIDLTAAAVPISDSDATISASGHLDFVTGNGGAALTAPGRIAINLSPLHSGSIPGLTAAWIARLAGGAAFYAAGSTGGPAFIMRSADGASTQQADVDLGMNAGDTSLRAVVRGKTDGAQGGMPDNVNIEEIRLEGNRIPLSIGELSGHVGLSGVTGPLILVQGNAHADVTIANPVLGPLTATSLTVSGDGQLHLDGPTIALTPHNLSVTAVDATTPALSLPGQTTLALVDSGGEPQSLGLVMSGGGSPTLSFGLSAAARGVRLTRPVRDGDTPDAITVDLPHARFDGYVVPATGLYDVGLRIVDAMFNHPVADVHVSQFAARFLPGGGSGNGEAQLVRFMGEPQRTMRNASGPEMKYNFILNGQVIDISLSILTPKSQVLGNMTGRMNLADGHGHVSLDAPSLTFGEDAITAQDVFTASSGVMNLEGTAAISLKADWDPTAGSSSGQISLTDLGFHTPRLAVSGLDMKLDLNSLWPLKAEGPQHIAVASVTAGLPFRDVTLDVEMPGDNSFVITQGSAAAADGHVSAANGSISIADSQATLPITLTRLALEPYGVQMGIDGLTGTGTVSGVLPIRIANGGLWVEDGHIKSDGPGHLNYRPAVRPAAVAKNRDSLFTALANFDYDSIIATINGDPLSTPRIWMTIKGRNTDLPDSDPMSLEFIVGDVAAHVAQQAKIMRHPDAGVAGRPDKSVEQENALPSATH